MSENLFDLTSKVAVITGSARGLGKAIAQGLANAGAKVVIADIDQKEAQVTAQEIQSQGGDAIALGIDVSVRTDCVQLVNNTVAHYGKLNIMVCNAGIDIIKPAEFLEEHEWDKIVDVDLKGYFNCAQLAARQMLEQKTGGSIIMTSSIASVVGIHGLVAYSAASRCCQSIGANHGG